MAADKPETLSTFEFFRKFPDEEAARKFFEARRWGDEPVCGHCGSVNVVECKDHKPMPYRCRDCRKHFSVRTGTVLAESRLPLIKWLLAIFMLTSARKGIPSTQMARELGITQKSAWFLAQRIRETWLKDRDDRMGGQMQVDETYVGGREKNKHANKKQRAGRGAVGKAVVVGVRYDTGEVRAMVVENTKGATLQKFVEAHCESGATIVTDTHGGYVGLKAAGYHHIRINHSVGDYVLDMAHTNGIESFWSLLKRGYIGVYHYMSPKHLNRYVKEFSFRHKSAFEKPCDGGVTLHGPSRVPSKIGVERRRQPSSRHARPPFQTLSELLRMSHRERRLFGASRLRRGSDAGAMRHQRRHSPRRRKSRRRVAHHASERPRLAR